MITAILSYRRATVAALSLALASFSLLSSVYAGTIINMSLGSETAADVSFDGTTFGTVSDGGPGLGDQQTNVDFLGALSSETNIPASDASFTLAGLVPDGDPTIFFGIAFAQAFTGGTFILYDQNDDVLLAGALNSSLMTGAIATGSGGAFTADFGSFTSGSLLPLLTADSLTMSINLDDADFSLPNDELAAFTANAQVQIGGDPIPEPASIALALIAGAVVVTITRRRK